MTEPPTFNPALDAPTRHIDSTAWADIYVVGDVHGCRDTLERLLDELAPTEDDLVVFVGDLVRKGPDSKGVLDLVGGRPNLVSVRGNNEQKLVDGRKSIDALTDADYDYVESLPVALTWDDALVVHGGIDHRKPVAEHTLTELLNNRSLLPDGSYDRPYWFETRRESPRVFFGHTVLAEPLVTDHAVGLDTGCVYGGQLSAYDYRADELVTVEPPETYVSRSADSIVEPRVADPTEGQ
ncbi:metallophosphoesterase family protein [Haloarcula onubensis]|uniref:Serine/threonine protein phosphatase n=1 Tax=Haloarcula onubensis TaxID=2950539 RepID=A0ABU2FS84_9EURY|nr:metallophosphoesterase family protein [Halomicroarcula sp. S3CR25-11]MDS0283632.1 serine/threonine protein phosphatase [Halomicroarcula sp. S3CR25-11]